ncbi:aspartate carbamoyltransferase regulatory subunit [Citroniella saccharovorans]|uniref:Aspartate carbamoyltransferase regulatory subunit n=1 Tax=Citroniella saccharovorans TaxID=2053367 RepID=A0AAW9MXG8_9FIRM|nr:aspartate carbamoyltransferase regulatory subunit [Citroniella saccharovorans]MEB3429568.1 aspartate carbamoyltransferase regulatory subunit [Citroniella saccharovorans]
MLNVSSLKKGIVIDHISPGNGYEIFKLLELDKADYRVALIINAESKKYGKKDLIKIENEIDLDLRVLALLDDNLTINIIDNEKIIEKVELKLPESFVGLFKCKNPRCVSVNERDIEPKFDLVDKEKKIYKCSYCDHLLNMED